MTSMKTQLDLDAKFEELILEAKPEERDRLNMAFFLGNCLGSITGHELLMRKIVMAANDATRMHGATKVDPELFVAEVPEEE